MRVVLSPFSMPKLPDNTPNLMQQGLSNTITPIRTQKQEKGYKINKNLNN